MPYFSDAHYTGDGPYPPVRPQRSVYGASPVQALEAQVSGLRATIAAQDREIERLQAVLNSYGPILKEYGELKARLSEAPAKLPPTVQPPTVQPPTTQPPTSQSHPTARVIDDKGVQAMVLPNCINAITEGMFK